MFEREATLYRFMNGYLLKAIADFDDAALVTPVPGSINPPAYILGHLATSNDSALQLFGLPGVCPPEWKTAFGPGSSPDKMQIPFPSRDELLAALQTGHDRVLAAAPQADPAAMAKRHHAGMFRGTPIETVADLVALLMTTHFALHVGQLSLMRRQHGQPPLF